MPRLPSTAAAATFCVTCDVLCEADFPTALRPLISFHDFVYEQNSAENNDCRPIIIIIRHCVLITYSSSDCCALMITGGGGVGWG